MSRPVDLRSQEDLVRELDAAVAARLKAEAERDRMRKALKRIADPAAEWNDTRRAQREGRPGGTLPFEIARAALSPSPEETNG